MRVAKVRCGALHLSFGQPDQLVENHSLLRKIATLAVPAVAVPAVAVPAIAVPTVTVPTIATPFQPRELVTERTNPLLVVLATWLANGFTNLTLEPGVESTVDLPLCVRISLGGRPLPTFADPYDLLQVLALIEVVLACDVHRIAWVVKRPSLVVDRS